MQIRRGDIFYADLSPVRGSEQGGLRPVLILQNDIGNKFSPTTIAAAITTKRLSGNQPTHVHLERQILRTESTVLLEQIRTLDKSRLHAYVCRVEDSVMKEVDKAVGISFGL